MLEMYLLRSSRRKTEMRGKALINELPVEIVLQIFETVAARPKNTLDTHAAPWTLAQVCSAWRKSALGLSTLWSTIILEAQHTAGTRPAAILKEYLRRSGGHPLFIGVKSTAHVDNDSFVALLDILIRQSRRWKVIEISAGISTLESIPHKLALPILEEFCIKSNTHAVTDETMFMHTDVARTFLRAPTLRMIDYRDGALTPAPGQTSSATHLGCRLPTLTQIVHLETYPSITELHLFCADTMGDVDPVVLPCLERLSVLESHTLRALICPSLSTLAVRQRADDSPQDISQFLTQSRCSLRVLSLLDGALLAQVDLSHTALDRVARLALPVPASTLATAARLCSLNILPNLRTITVFVSKEQFQHPEICDAVATLLEFRHARAGLRRVRLYCTPIDQRRLMVAGLAELQNDGLEVVMDTYNSVHDDWTWWKGPYWFPEVPDD
ncbi:hypothetical protein CYLTODRAFT_492000 [Cylindrobasidium torrendii FP15055 ss-10]|uniref:Uncharacterized protein n=1 Tax=Cylindrobasidium torrendii FP15055 ss-10 TaxID=1314674 RepID=A0A0D7B6K3_9AGAR|nr:hypothetical protein CYLTODRAFT_492000 [Cylindrobasidium torrendii FP15055 ss-10]